MPLRWKLPTYEEADELYRRIDQLITDLYHLIRSVLFEPPHLQLQPEPPNEEDDQAVPDLLAHLGRPPPETDSKEGDNTQPPMR